MNKEKIMNIQQSRDYITNRTEWSIDDDTFQILDKERCMWIARVTTTHHKRRYEEAKKRAENLPSGTSIDIGLPEEHSFFVLVNYTEHFMLHESHLPVLLDW